METTKITAESLMIGDWVTTQGLIPNKKVNVRIVRLDEADELCNYEPIPLTAEILVKNNFEKHYDDDIIIYTHQQGIIIEMGINYKLFDDGHFF